MDWLHALLIWLAAEPAPLERPRAAAAVTAAYAALHPQPPVKKKEGAGCSTGNCPVKK